MLSLTDLIDIQRWQKIQDNFAAVMGVTIRTVDKEGNLLTSSSRETRLCSQILRNSPQKDKICGLCLPTFLGGKERVNKNLGFACETRLNSFLAPMKVDGETLGYLVVGPVVLVARKSKEEYQRVAEKLNVRLEDLWDAILEIKVISFHGVSSLLEMLQDIAEYTLNLAYQNMFSKKEVIMVLDSPKLKRLLEALLDVVFEVSGADIGSIMFLDKERKELTIKVSRGIPEEIVSKTRVRLGEGISGIAAENGEPFLIDNRIENKQANRMIRQYLVRPYLGSSMVLPLKIENEVLGVMNVGALDSSKVRFNNDNLNLVNRIIDLAAIAIRP